jgi:hypothetical protein
LRFPRDPGRRASARRYAHAFFFHLFQPFPLFAENASDVPTLRVNSRCALDPGGDVAPDRIYRGILHGGGIFADEEP